MTRTPPTAVELALAAEATRIGLTATPHQLERWRAQRWLAPVAQWIDPATDSLRPEIIGRAAWLAALSKPGRGISWIGWTFWAIDDTPQTAERLRHALTETLQMPLHRADIDLAQIPHGDTDSAFTARQELAGRLLDGRRAIGRDLDGILRAHAAAEGVALPAPRSVSNPFAKPLVEVGARLLIGGTADVSPEELTEAWGAYGAAIRTSSPGSPLRRLPPRQRASTWPPALRSRTACAVLSARSRRRTTGCCARRSAPARRRAERWRSYCWNARTRDQDPGQADG